MSYKQSIQFMLFSFCGFHLLLYMSTFPHREQMDNSMREISSYFEFNSTFRFIIALVRGELVIGSIENRNNSCMLKFYET